MVYTARSSRTWAGLLVCLHKVSPCSPSCFAWCARAVRVAALVLAGPARLCPRPFPCPASFLSWRVSFFLVLQFGFLPTTVWLLALGDLVRPRSWSFLYALSSWLASLASLILCLLNCNAPLGGVAQCWPGLARGLLLGDHYSGRYARAARAAAHPAAWLLIVAAIVIACVLASPAQYCPRLLPCPTSILSWHASFLLVSRGRLSIVEDDEEAPEMVDSASDGPSVPPDSARVAAPVLVPEVPTVAAHATRTPPALVATPDASLRGLRPLPQLLIWSGKRLMFPP
ncbi:hypothetical protein V6N13_032099 [Hibiscus sabdariffa]